jgi:hypothetical protein
MHSPLHWLVQLCVQLVQEVVLQVVVVVVDARCSRQDKQGAAGVSQALT